MLQNYINNVIEKLENISILHETVDTNLNYEYIKKFKNQKLEERIRLCDNILLRNINRVPIIIDGKNELNILKNKYIAPKNLTMGQFLFILKTKINAKPTDSIFILCNNKLVNNTDIIGDIYEKNKEEDGFLYMYVTIENTFGN